MKTRSETVSFRADQDLLKRIDKECGMFELSRGAWVRGIIMAHVFRDEEPRVADLPEELQQSVDEIKQQLEELRMNLAKAILIVLNTVGDIQIDEAREIVRSNLLQKSQIQ